MKVMHPAVSMAENQLTFGVPKGKRSALLRAMRGGDFHSQRMRAIYYDTRDGKLASHGISLRLRKEGKIWTQTAEIDTADPLLRLDHHVIVIPPGRSIIPAVALERHRGTAIFTKIMDAIGCDEKEALEERFRTDFQRYLHTVSHGISQASIVLDSGSIYRDKQSLPICELTLVLEQGKSADFFALADLWTNDNGLWINSVSKVDRGNNLLHARTTGVALTAVTRKIRAHEGKQLFLLLTLQNCLVQIIGNMSEIAAGGIDQQYVHQLRIGLRRIRTVLSQLSGFTEDLNRAWEPAFADVFRALGEDRDAEMVMPALLHEMHLAGIDYPWTVVKVPLERRPRVIVTAVSLQRTVLEVLAYCDISLAEQVHHHYSGGLLKSKARAILHRLHKQLITELQGFRSLSAVRQ